MCKYSKMDIKSNDEGDNSVPEKSLRVLRSKIDAKFKKQMKIRQNQLETIEKNLFYTRKILHMLRYVLITSYYKNEDVNTSSHISDNNSVKRLHPALKKLLPRDSNELNYSETKRKTKTLTKNLNVETNKPLKSNDASDADNKFSVSTPSDVESEPVDFSRNRVKVKKRIIIGNISKYLPSDSKEDCTTHKWMVYVRTPKNTPDISEFISQVTFYLHPSYKPNDIIEVRNTPFHLTRRGWGEFPLRLRLFFKLEINKPVDIVHNLKLDKTYSGRQTFGGETIVDLSIFENEKIIDFDDFLSFDCDKITDDFLQSPTTFSLNIDNFNTQIKNVVSLDHSYSLISSSNNFLDLDNFSFSDSNELISKLYEHENFNKNIKITILKFKNVLEALPFLFKKLPIITDLSSNQFYRNAFPYTTTSIEKYLSWNIGKRASSEWARAKYIYKLINSSLLNDKEFWDIKSIILYGRSFGYTPSSDLNIFNKEFNCRKLLNSMEQSWENSPKIENKIFVCKDNMVDIEMEEKDETNETNDNKECIKDEYNLECSFIRQIALDVGLVTKPEEIVPDVYYNCTERLLLEAFKYMAENLIRSARAIEIIKGNFNEPIDISYQSVEQAFRQRPESKFITDYKKNYSKF